MNNVRPRDLGQTRMWVSVNMGVNSDGPVYLKVRYDFGDKRSWTKEKISLMKVKDVL